MKIFVNLICQNSATELPALLESLIGRVDGLVAIDGGSTDNTVELLTAWGEENKIPVTCKVNEWPDDFAAQRNLCLDVTRVTYGTPKFGDDYWVLMIDSDDTLSQLDRPFIEESIAKAQLGSMLCWMDNGNGFFNVTQFFRLTREAVWQNPIHEYICTADAKGLPPEGKLTIKRGRSANHDRDPIRNVRIGRKFVERSPEDMRGRFYLARDLIECTAVPIEQRQAEAEGHLRIYLSRKNNFVEQDRFARLLLVRLLCDTGRVPEARDLLTRSIKNDPNNKSAYEALSRISKGAERAVWQRMADAADGMCVMPHASKLPIAIG